MTDPTPADGASFARANRILALALVSAPVYILVALWFAAPEAEEDLPTWLAGVAIAAVVLGCLLVQSVGYRVAPLDFGVASGHLTASITLDGRQSPIQAQARVGAGGGRLVAVALVITSGTPLRRG